MIRHQRIAGRLDYRALAEMNRPSDPAKIAAEIFRLHEGGLTTNDISMALRMPLDTVINIIASPPTA